MPFFKIFSRKICDYRGIYGGQTFFSGNFFHNAGGAGNGTKLPARITVLSAKLKKRTNYAIICCIFYTYVL